MIAQWIDKISGGAHNFEGKCVRIDRNTVYQQLEIDNPWLFTDKLVVKPDQLIKRRGKAGLLGLNCTWEEAQAWIKERMLKDVTVDGVTGVLENFIVEPFTPHAPEDEYYICIQSQRGGEEILFTHEGGVDVGDVDAKAERLTVPIGSGLPAAEIEARLLSKVPAARQARLASFLEALFKIFTELHFAYMEINPLVMTDDKVVPLDLAAKLDECAAFKAASKWGSISFPSPFGRPLTPAEQYVQDLDSKTGSSLKLTILNDRGRVWTMVAGGGASVVYADTVTDLGAGSELANYGEYSGAPSEELTYEYAKTILGLMTVHKDERGKILIIGGGIANFTDVAKTFKGIIAALIEYKDKLVDHKVRIYVRRGGPNYQEGLRLMKETGTKIGVPMVVTGPQDPMTLVVGQALREVPGVVSAQASEGGESSVEAKPVVSPTAAQRVAGMLGESKADDASSGDGAPALPKQGTALEDRTTSVYVSEEDVRLMEQEAKDGAAGGGGGVASYNLFTSQTQCIVFGLQPRAVQGMLDFDYLCKRSTRSVACMVFPFSSNHFTKFYWGNAEVMVPVYQKFETAIEKHPNASVLVNFSSSRSVHPVVMEALQFPQIKTIAIIAEGVPESQTRDIIKQANEKAVTVIGPATVGGIKPGCFRIGNTGGMIDNIMQAKLYRPGSVAYVSKSGGMSNELNNLCMRYADGVYEGVAIGGDRYPGTRFVDHLLRYEANPAVKMMVLLGEVGGIDEYEVCELVKAGKITKPVVAWCIGTCAKCFATEVQFGHAGALARSNLETADAKNAALSESGAHVPASFDTLPDTIKRVYDSLVAAGTITVKEEPEPPKVPMDYNVSVVIQTAAGASW